MINWKSLKAQGKIKLKLKMCNIFLVLQHFFFEILITFNQHHFDQSLCSGITQVQNKQLFNIK